MSEIDYSGYSFPIREDLVSAHRRAWQRIGEPGTWLSARERILVAQETRQAEHCRFCDERAVALSPYAVVGEHDSCTDLSAIRIEAIHTIRRDQSRITDAWFESLLERGLLMTEYVELTGVIATVMAIDRFCDALGIERHALPQPQPGEPTQHIPAGAKPGLARVMTVAPEDVSEAEADLYNGMSGANIHRALSLVPAEVQGFFDLDSAMYLPDAKLRDFDDEPRAISHAQIEFLAARVSALNRCYY